MIKSQTSKKLKIIYDWFARSYVDENTCAMKEKIIPGLKIKIVAHS